MYQHGQGCVILLCMCVCLCVCVRACVRACVHAFMRACVKIDLKAVGTVQHSTGGRWGKDGTKAWEWVSASTGGKAIRSREECGMYWVRVTFYKGEWEGTPFQMYCWRGGSWWVSRMMLCSVRVVGGSLGAVHERPESLEGSSRMCGGLADTARWAEAEGTQKEVQWTASLLLQYYYQRVQLCKLASMAKAVALVSTRKNRKEASSKWPR